MKNLSIGVATLAMVLVMGTVAQAATVHDEFNRPNSATVGNGWQEGNQFGDLDGLEIWGNHLAAITGSGLIHRSVSLEYPVRIRARLHPGGCWNGGSEVGNHIFSTFMIKSGGENFFDGFGIEVFRGDSSDLSPQVCRVKGGVTDVCTSPSNTWITHNDVELDDVQLDAKIYDDGEITGSISSSSSRIDFQFDPTSMVATGGKLQVSIITACPGRPSAMNDLIVDGAQDVGSTRTPTSTPASSTSLTTPTPTMTPNGSGIPTHTRTSGGGCTSNCGGGIGHPSGGGGGCSVSDAVAVDRRVPLFLVLLPVAFLVRRRSRA